MGTVATVGITTPATCLHQAYSMLTQRAVFRHMKRQMTEKAPQRNYLVRLCLPDFRQADAPMAPGVHLAMA
jgi:hypothetical protein